MEELKNKLIKKVPEKFWLRFVKKCKKRKVTVLQGFIEATSINLAGNRYKEGISKTLGKHFEIQNVIAKEFYFKLLH